MTKAIRLIEENAKLVDAVIYVLDARAPYSSLNPDFEKLLERKPALLLLNKADLADKRLTKEWVQEFARRGYTALPLTATSKKAASAVSEAVGKLLSERTERFKQKGANVISRAMIIGVPNSGKSTLLNSLAGGKRAETGDRPGVTRGRQWLRLPGGLEVLDTPGTLWNAFPDQRIARHLAYIGSISADVVDAVELAASLLSELAEICPGALTARYGLDLSISPHAQLEMLCERRAYRLRGGALDLERAAAALLDDFRKCRIAPITLEKPGDFTGWKQSE